MDIQIQQLIKIFNALATISTKGEDTLMMADCLRLLEDIIKNLKNFLEQKEE